MYYIPIERENKTKCRINLTLQHTKQVDAVATGLLCKSNQSKRIILLLSIIFSKQASCQESSVAASRSPSSYGSQLSVSSLLLNSIDATMLSVTQDENKTSLNETVTSSLAPSATPTFRQTSSPTFMNASVVVETFRQSYCGPEIEVMTAPQITAFQVIHKIQTKDYGPYGGEPTVKTECLVLDQQLVRDVDSCPIYTAPNSGKFSSGGNNRRRGIRRRAQASAEQAISPTSPTTDTNPNITKTRELIISFSMSWSSKFQKLDDSQYVESFMEFMNVNTTKSDISNQLNSFGLRVVEQSNIRKERNVLSQPFPTPAPTTIIPSTAPSLSKMPSFQPTDAANLADSSIGGTNNTSVLDQTSFIASMSLLIVLIALTVIGCLSYKYYTTKRRNMPDNHNNETLNHNINDFARSTLRKTRRISSVDYRDPTTSSVSKSSHHSRRSYIVSSNLKRQLPASQSRDSTSMPTMRKSLSGNDLKYLSSPQDSTTVQKPEAQKTTTTSSVNGDKYSNFFDSDSSDDGNYTTATTDINNSDIVSKSHSQSANMHHQSTRTSNGSPHGGQKTLPMYYFCSNTGLIRDLEDDETEEDELDKFYKDDDLEKLRNMVEEKVQFKSIIQQPQDPSSASSTASSSVAAAALDEDVYSNMMSRAFVRALLMEEEDSMVELGDTAGVKTKMVAPNELDVEANFMSKCWDWMKRMDKPTIQQKNEFFQKIINEVVTCVLYHVVSPNKASQIIHECSSLLKLNILKKELPGNTLMVSGLRKNVKNRELKKAFRAFGEISESAVGTKTRGFGFVRYKSSQAADKAMERYRMNEIVVEDVAVVVRKLKASPRDKHDSSNSFTTNTTAGSNHSASHHGYSHSSQIQFHSGNTMQSYSTIFEDYAIEDETATGIGSGSVDDYNSWSTKQDTVNSTYELPKTPPLPHLNEGYDPYMLPSFYSPPPAGEHRHNRSRSEPPPNSAYVR